MADVGLSQDYRDLLICLADTGAEFLLVGGWALALHGHGRGKLAAGRAKDLADVE